MSGAALIWAAMVAGVASWGSIWLTWFLSRRSARTTTVDAVTQARADLVQANARLEADRERERAEDKDEILRSRTEVERLRAEVAERDRRIYQLLGGGIV